ncbi:GAF domain-containing protein [Micromonospora purpureochromogenes]|uniref:GAF domain-containing protein n=1 Tax=Micromonospora purpureochromogenes TaxID=47872 RepID=A0A1C4XNE5_9ACTN|nr:GAF and ANTAR domain-containing protein [Micromonospora purpureochromogenes]SCF09906.1 GAF domain-containing protein [Micromonospora purpureochromogenes]
MSSPRPDQPSHDLTETLLVLAGLPDDAPALPEQLRAIVRLAAEVVGPVDFASVTVLAADGNRTDAASDEAANALDLAQYADDAGPCLVALHTGETVGVPDIAGAVVWPGFRDVAWRYGVRASLSIPLFAGSGNPVGALNLYSRDAAGMRLLIQRVESCYHPGRTQVRPRLDVGSEQLLAGLAGALHTRDLIQRALGLLMDRDQVPAGSAYRQLVEATEPGQSLTGTASVLLHQDPR